MCNVQGARGNGKWLEMRYRNQLFNFSDNPVNQDLALMRNVSGFHLLVYAKNGGRNRVGSIAIPIKKYREPTIVANLKAPHLSGNTFAYANALARP